MILCVIFLCLCATGTVFGSPNSLKDPYICGSPTCAEPEKFKYLLDVIYHYEYKVNVETYFAGSSNNRSTLDVRAVPKIQFITPCEGLLQLTDVTLIDQDENYPVERAEKFIHAVSLFDLRFAFHDGVVSEICPEPAEEDWVLNFKRAILTLFQNTMKRFDINFKGVEQDIHGTCNVDYTVRGQENTSLILVKTRDLSQCTNRYKYMSILQTVRYDFQSKFQTWPVLKSESKCRITVDHHIYKAVTCRERHLFEPFSGKNSGAMTTVVQDLVLMREVNKTDTEVIESQPKAWVVIPRRSNLLHHHIVYVGDDTGGLKSAREVLKLLCMVKDTTTENHHSLNVDENMDSGSTVGLWGRLVRSARPLHYPALSQLLARAPTICKSATKHILDALPYIASPGSVELIKDMIMKNAVEDDTRHEWLMSMAMIPRPKKQMLNSMLELLQKQKNDKVISFTVSSMVHSYCKHSGKELRECCEEDTPRAIALEFENIVQEISAKGVIKTREDRNNIIIAIKALGNIGGFNKDFADKLLNIIGDSLVPVPVRLAAVDAFRRTTCDETREYFLETFRADYMNLEVRLASYVQVMKCPDLGTLRKIFHTLQDEPVNQVTTFVWSHLRNLAESSLPSRVEIQGLLSGNQIPHLEDSPDFRMYSRNYEQGMFFDQYNAGGNYEANVVFTPDSYIPRSFSLNLTVDMFGESINLFEMKARGEGFERYFESYFGNNGPLNKNKLTEKISNLRFFRSTNEADEVREKIDNLEYKNEALKHRFPMAELGIKVFGNEISYWNAEGDEEIMKSLARLNPQLRVLEILSGKEISYNKASLFLDTTFSVPTGAGLPMNMNLMGTSYVNTKMSGTVLDNYRESGNLDFEGKLRPSVAVNIAATMSVDAGGLSSSGIRVNWRLYTATAVEARLTVRGIALLKLDLSLPIDKQEIFAAKSELIILHGDKEHQQQGLNKNRIEQNTCSWSTFDKSIGIKMCASYQFPNMTNLRNAPYFLMSGPAKYILSLEKADPTAKTYAIEYRWDKNATGNVVSFSFDTPDSKEKRMINAVLSISNTSSTALLTLQSEKSTLKAKAMYKNKPYDKSLSASLDVDGRKQFDTVMSVKRHDIKYGFVWIPHAYWVVDNERVAELSGVIKVKTKGSVTQSDIEAEFQTKQLASHLLGYYTINGPTHGTKLQFDYQFFKNPKQTIKIEGIYSEKTGGFRHDLYGDLSMAFTAYPEYNFYTVLRNIKTQSHVDIGFNVSASREKKLDPAFTFSFQRAEHLTGMRLDTRLTLHRPRLIDTRFQFEGIGPKYTALALLNFNPKSREILVSGYLFFPPGTQLYLDAELNMTLPTLHPCSIKTKVHEKQPNDFQVNAAGVWFTGVDFNVDASYQDQSKTNMASHHLKALISSTHFKNIAMDGRFTQDNRQITFIGQGEYNDEHYRTLIRYILLSEQNFTTYVEVDVGGKAYSVNLNADLSNNTNVNMDIHFDQLRDLHFSYQRWVSARQKRLSAAFNWDANRDPSQKVSIDVQLDNKGTWHHGGHVSLYYPGRMVNGEFEFLLRDWFCQWHIRMGWSSESNILWRVKMYSEAHNETVYALLSNMNTPFAGWKDTSFNVMWRYHDNLQALNGSMNWQEDYLAFSLLADYLFKTNEFYGEINAVVNSTIPTLPKAAAIAKHRVIWKKSADTLLSFQVEINLIVIELKTKKIYDKNNAAVNFTIPTLPKAAAIAKHRVIWKKSADTLLSFQYNEDGLLMINSSWTLDRGHTENNITGRVTLLTPFQVICAVSQTACIEVFLKLVSLQDFHVFGHVALPIQYLNRAMVIAKRAPEEFGIAILLEDNGKALIDVLRDKFQHESASSSDMFIENFDTRARVVLDTLYYPTITFNAHLMKFVGPEEEDILEVNATLHLPNLPPLVLTDVFVLEEYTVMRNTLNLVTPFQAVKELKSVYTVDITLGEKINVTCLVLLYNGTYWHEISYKIFYEYECGEDDTYQSYVASVGIATPLPVLPALEARVAARLEDALWKMSADIAMPSFTITALASLELDDPFVETSGSLNLTSGYLEDYFIKMQFKKDFSDVENVVGGGIQIQQGDQNNYMALTLVPKGQGDNINIRIKYENTPTVYTLSAHFAGPVAATLHAKAELEGNFTDINVKSRVDNYPGLRKVLSVQAATPLNRIRYVKGDTDFIFGPKTGYLLCKYELPDMKGEGDLKWSFLLGDLFIKIEKSVDLDIHFGNSTTPDMMMKTDAGFRMDLDHVWVIGANTTFGLIPNKQINLVINAILPKPNVDVHTLYIDVDAGSNEQPLKTLEAEYRTDVTKIVTGVKGDWDVNGSNHVDYTLTSPMFDDKPTLKVKGSYQKDLVHTYHIVKGDMHHPGDSQIGEIDLRYGGVKHTDGHFNFTTPFKRLPWLKSIFDINNLEESSDNKVNLFWPNKTASVNTTHRYHKRDKGFTQNGEISLSVPLSRQHVVNTEYYYIQDDKTSNGNATIDFDHERFVKGSFDQILSKSDRNLDLATMNIEVENVHTPVGIKYIHEYDNTGNIDVKQATVFHLHNATKFNVTGKLDIYTYDIGKDLKLTAIHGNRTWTFDNKYEAVDKELKQGSKIKWAEDVWFNYDLHVTNMTTLVMNVWYPLRTFNLVALYNLQDTLLDGSARLHWNVKEENKTAELRGRWENPPVPEGNLHHVDLSLAHPSFRKDVTLKGQYLSTPSVMSNISLELQYSDYENEYLQLNSILTDNSNGPVRDYKFALICKHPSTNLDLDMKSDINIRNISYHMVGQIVDTRYAKFDSWRNFDDVVTVDLASYIRLNHSRLLTSSIKWRPQIFTEVKSQAVSTLKLLYSQVNDTLIIMKEMPMEAHLALKNIWTDAKPRIRDFLDDLNDLHVIKDDLDEFERFLNQSYSQNDFYVKDIVEFTYYVLDEMAIRNHLESLPGIVNDMWGMMGNTSQSIKQSLTYIVDSIKKAYANFLESVNKVLEADFMELVSDRLEAMILQYDTFIRDLHMKFLEYWEETWVNATNRLSKYWHEVLKSIEPLFFKVLHYSESFVFAVGKNVMDFFYNRTQELTDSPYFNYVSTFGHEMDRIYKDLMNNDLITNIKKYSKKLFNFVWAKIEKYIPFKDEFTQLYAEFRNAWENFLKTKQVVYVREKYQEAYVRLKWWYDYFLIGEALETVGEILYAKLTDMSKTALQYEELHRTPKTNFIFDPRVGAILLEQKLPMSWHAFNRTPDFTEISEYRAVKDFMDEWLTTNKSMAMMTGQGTLVTFDKRVFTISEAGTFLLTRDYRQDNFTVLMESNDQGRYNLLLLTRRSLIHIDLYKELIIPIPSIGWFYATLGGLLGTYNNEQYDDLLLPNNTFTTSIPTLGHSWNIVPSANPTNIENKDLKNDTQCEKFFQNKVSPLNPCFSVIPSLPLYSECLSGGDACALASAYKELCLHEHVPTHMPDHCHQCTTPQGDVIEEGAFHILQYIPNSTDVVFIVEAQYCNKNLRKSKNMDLFVEAFDIKLQANGYSDNRYAIVGFGGSGVYRRPRALYVNNKVFTNPIEVSLHLDNFIIDKADLVRGNRTRKADMFAALSFATQLPFRAAVPKTFILMPCSKCDSTFMRLDYSTIYHNLMESSVTLHILMDDDFMLSKKRAAKYLFAYTNKDYERLVGDSALRKQVKLPKEKLGLCTSLAMETN
ncbi:hypothetical protein HF086_017932, partial [Spodoptera exigua]